MPRMSRRSRSLRRIKKKLPGGSTKLVYAKRQPGTTKCSICHIELKGIPRMRPFEARNMAKTKKRPERAYGGFLCANCLREKLKQEARQS
ncbi:50S ribosomal protein L34e [Candidatus Woesearchaeota archaeon]|nr:50S ribosomal protein L34e [Candidatus Woesearchaeota archaeon]